MDGLLIALFSRIEPRSFANAMGFYRSAIVKPFKPRRRNWLNSLQAKPDRMALAEQSAIDYHRRLGWIDEWRDVLTPEQIEHVNRHIPDEFWSLFGWEP